MGTFSSIVNTWIANRRTRQTARNIEKNNELRKNITRYEPSDIEGFIERDPHVGSYIISGGHALYRARAAASIAACSLVQNVPIIILHEGNLELQNQIVAATSFSKDRVIIAKGTSVYDPFYNRTNQEICNLIINSTRNPADIGPIGQQYLTGVSEFIRSKQIPPYCEMFVSCPHDELFDKIDDAEKKGYLPSTKAIQIRNHLMQGQGERAGIQSFFSQLSYQGAGILSNRGSRNSAVNVKTAVNHNGLLMIDIGSSTNDILLNLLINEVKECLAAGKRIMLLLDGININSNDLLSKIIKSLSSRCLTTLVSEDVYSMLGADDNLFNSFAGNACKCIVFQHSIGVSCTKWADVFGYYDVNKISQNVSNTQNYQWGYGFGSANSINVSTEREHIVKPEELARLNMNEVYILDRNAQELAFTTIR